MDARKTALTGTMVGLAAALYLLSPGQLPNAGRISLEMLPIFYLSFRYGARIGMLAGGVLGLVILLIDPRFVHPVQIILDYPLANMLAGCAGFVRKNIFLGVLIGGLGRFFAHFISGIIFFAAFTPQGMPVALYSLIYNGSYILPQMILAWILLPVMMKKLRIDE
ncbi:energy-coupled thiamine transporter ThiT [bacterium]|nr:energy-coupled thiamine transporter ThiT [bacterium]